MATDLKSALNNGTTKTEPTTTVTSTQPQETVTTTDVKKEAEIQDRAIADSKLTEEQNQSELAAMADAEQPRETSPAVKAAAADILASMNQDDSTEYEVEATSGRASASGLSFADVAVTHDNILDRLQEEQIGGVSYTYRHRRTRDFRIPNLYGDDFHFQDFQMTINSEELNQAWIKAYKQLPIDERTQIYQYDAEAAARVERPVGESGFVQNKVARGLVGTGQIKDQKILGNNPNLRST